MVEVPMHMPGVSRAAYPPGAEAGPYAAMASRWLGRAVQIKALLDHLGTPTQASRTLLVYGGPASGKTAVVRDVLRELRRPVAYASCVEFGKRRPLMQSILNQLKGQKRTRENGFAGSAKCESVGAFQRQLEAAFPEGGRAAYVVLDHAERLAGGSTLTSLLCTRGATGANVNWILISEVGWGSGAFAHDTLPVPRPACILFPAYSNNTLFKLLTPAAPAEHRRPPAAVAQLVPVFQRVSRRLPDLCAAMDHMCAAAAAAAVAAAANHAAVEAAERCPSDAGTSGRSPQRRSGGNGGGGGGVGVVKAQFWNALENFTPGGGGLGGAGASARSREVLDFELPFLSKFLLLAAFVASRNPPATDRHLFQPRTAKRRRSGALSHDRQVELVAAARLRGPHFFPLERLLAICWALLAADAAAGEEEPQPAGAHVRSSAEALRQIRTLVSLRLLTQTSADVLNGAKFWCNISERTAEMIASNVKLPLRNFVVYA